jgi:type VI secretion system protein ImpK
MSGQPVGSAIVREQLLAGLAAQLSRAARRGALEEAAADLEKLLNAVPDWVSGLDLLARIRAQQGRIAEAIRLWSAATMLAPDNQQIAASLVYASSHGGVGDRAFRAGWALLGLLVLAAVVGAGLYKWRLGNREPDLTTSAPERPVDTRGSESRGSMPSPPVGKPGHPPAFAGFAGIRIDTVGDALGLTPTNGLFAKGTELTVDGARVLERLGAKLASSSDSLSMTVIGHTDSIPFAAGSVVDNEWLGFKRATTVMRYLHLQGGIPMGSMVARSAGASRPPYESLSGLEQRRNRTVTFLVARRELRAPGTGPANR